MFFPFAPPAANALTIPITSGTSDLGGRIGRSIEIYKAMVRINIRPNESAVANID